MSAAKEAPGPVVLVVDDERALRDLLVIALKRRGYRPRQAANGVRALAIARKEKIDAAILDLVMPGMNGIELLERLKREQPKMAAVMTTGVPAALSAVRAAELGAFAYLAKPYELSALMGLLRDALGERGKA